MAARLVISARTPGPSLRTVAISPASAPGPLLVAHDANAADSFTSPDTAPAANLPAPPESAPNATARLCRTARNPVSDSRPIFTSPATSRSSPPPTVNPASAPRNACAAFPPSRSSGTRCGRIAVINCMPLARVEVTIGWVTNFSHAPCSFLIASASGP